MEHPTIQTTVGDPGVEELRKAGFTEAGIVRLVRARQRYLAGRFSDQTRESNYWSFIRWLIEHGRLQR